MTEEKTEDKTTIGEAAGLVPSAKLAEVEDARLKEAAANTRLREDLEARDTTIAELKSELDKAQKERAAAEKASKYAEGECVKAKGTESKHKREEARLETANTALSQEVDQLRGKGSELWESLTTSNKVRDEAVKRSAALQVEMDEAQSGINAIGEFLQPVIEPLATMILEVTKPIMDILADPDVQAELERLTKLKEADAAAKRLGDAALEDKTEASDPDAL